LKRRDLERLAEHGCNLTREGTQYEIWTSAPLDRRPPVLRHRKISVGTARAVCRQRGIPAPSGPR